MRLRATTLLLIAAAAPVLAQEARLEVSRKPQMLDCGDGRACFRLEVNAVDSGGRPLKLSEKTQFEVSQDGTSVPVILRRSVDGTGSEQSTGAPTPRITLVLFDTSGSMNQRLPGGQTKFDMARAQLQRLFQTFQDGVDQMAIAPFDSIRVSERIRAASFQTTRAGLRAQVARLRPTPQGNTALFSAVHEGLQVLQPRVSGDARISLIAFTDGMNDVGHSTDDQGLLEGESGLQQVTRLTEEVGIPVYTVGYGAPGVAFDERAMQELAYPDPPKANHYFSAENEAALIEAFKKIEDLGALAFRLLVGPIPQRRDQLSNQSLVFRVSAANMTGESPRWRGNPLMVPPWEGTLTTEERAAVIGGPGAPPVNPADGLVDPVIIRMLVLVTYATVIALLWFGLPRLLWPERYIPKPAYQPPPAGAARPTGRTMAQPRPTSYARPEVTISGTEPGYRPRQAPSDPGAGRARREPPPAPPRTREPLPPREASDATVFIPPPRKPGGDS